MSISGPWNSNGLPSMDACIFIKKVTLKLFGTMQIIFFLTKFFEFFREYSTDEQHCEYAALVKAFKIILLGWVWLEVLFDQRWPRNIDFITCLTWQFNFVANIMRIVTNTVLATPRWDTYIVINELIKTHFRAIGAAAITALRSANYQSTLEEALQVYEIEIVILVLKRCRTLAICHVFFAFW